MNYKVKINGVERSFSSINFSRKLSGIGEFSIDVVMNDVDYTLGTSDTIEVINPSGKPIFLGIITKDKRNNEDRTLEGYEITYAYKICGYPSSSTLTYNDYMWLLIAHSWLESNISSKFGVYQIDISNNETAYSWYIDYPISMDIIELICKARNLEFLLYYNTTTASWKIDFRYQAGEDKSGSVKFEIGENIESIEYVKDITEYVTNIKCYGSNITAIAGNNGTRLKTYQFKSITNQDKLNQIANNLLTYHQTPLESITIKTPYVYDLNPGDWVWVKAPEYSIDNKYRIREFSVAIDAKTGESMTLQLANKEENFIDKIANAIKTTADLAKGY